MNRREFLVSGSAASVLASPVFAKASGSTTILGISCSPRKGKTTATGVAAALAAAEKVDSSIEVEMIDLGDMFRRLGCERIRVLPLSLGIVQMWLAQKPLGAQ